MTTAEMDNLQTGERQREDEAGFGGGRQQPDATCVCMQDSQQQQSKDIKMEREESISDTRRLSSYLGC